ncbi:MAG: hypothetical protein ABH967_02780 [Patescibacteria group bacterium]
MKIVIENFLNRNIVMALRRAGYIMLGEYDEGAKLSFVKKLDLNYYPRFHVYLKINHDDSVLTLDLHLDQKKPVYETTPDHGAEYEGVLIEQEMERLKSLLK